MAAGRQEAEMDLAPNEPVNGSGPAGPSVLRESVGFRLPRHGPGLTSSSPLD